MSTANSADLANKIIQSENKLTNAMNRCNISVAGQSYIDTALDLFKDSQGGNPCIGYPDMAARNIVVQKIRKTMVISRPASVPAGSTWDCHIVNKQCNNVIPTYSYNGGNQNVYIKANPQVNTGNYGGIMVFAGPANVALGQADIVANLGLDSSYFNADTSGRVIGKAHEVCNTTNKLNAQGNVVVYQKPTCPYDEASSTISFTDAADATVYGNLTTFIDFDGLGIPSELLNLPKSKQWSAIDGVYQTCVMNSTVNTPGTDRQFAIAFRDGKVAVPGLYATQLLYDVVNATTKATSVPFTSWPLISPFNESGCYFQGLSSETTLQLTGCWLFESTPSRSQLSLTTLTHISPPFDACALELYSKLAHALPSGVPFSDNGAGDWIQYVAEAAEVMGVPGAKVIKKAGKWVSDFELFRDSNYGMGVPTALVQSNNRSSMKMNKDIARRNTKPPRKRNNKKKKNPISTTNKPKNTRRRRVNRGEVVVFKK